MTHLIAFNPQILSAFNRPIARTKNIPFTRQQRAASVIQFSGLAGSHKRDSRGSMSWAPSLSAGRPYEPFREGSNLSSRRCSSRSSRMANGHRAVMQYRSSWIGDFNGHCSSQNRTGHSPLGKSCSNARGPPRNVDWNVNSHN